MRIDLPLIGAFHAYDERSQAHAERTATFLRQHSEAAFERSCAPGHITASGFILSPDMRMVLVIHHTKLDKWLQPGGHCDGDHDVRRVAKRECLEETGLHTLAFLEREIFDIDVHQIPERGGEPAHLHFDIRFLFTADPDATLTHNDQAKNCAWFTKSRLFRVTTLPSVRIVARVLTSA